MTQGDRGGAVLCLGLRACVRAGGRACATRGPDITWSDAPPPSFACQAAQLLGVEPCYCVGYEDARLGLESIRAAGYLAGIDVTALEGYPHLVEPPATVAG